MKRVGLSTLIFLFSIAASAAVAEYPQDLSKFKKLADFNRRATFPVGFNGYGFGPVGGLALTVDYFITPKVALELGGGFRDQNLNNGFTLGARYHVFGKTFLSLTPYIGLYTAFHHNGSDLQNYGIYIPAGIHKIKKNGFCWSVEVAWQQNTFSSHKITGGFRLGYRFKTGKSGR